MTHVILDGTLIRSDCVAGLRDKGNDLWFSQEPKAFGGNVQFLAAPDGTPLWVSDAAPASTRFPPFTRLPPTGCQPWRQGIHRRRHRHLGSRPPTQGPA